MTTSRKVYICGLVVCCITGAASPWIESRTWLEIWEFGGGLLAGHLIQHSNWIKKDEDEDEL